MTNKFWNCLKLVNYTGSFKKVRLAMCIHQGEYKVLECLLFSEIAENIPNNLTRGGGVIEYKDFKNYISFSANIVILYLQGDVPVFVFR